MEDTLARRIKEAHEHIADIKRKQEHDADYLRRQRELEDYQDLRDDVVSYLRNSGVKYDTIHERCGPTPQTLLNWENKTVSKPQLGKMRAALRIIGKDLGVIDRRGQP